MGNWFSNLHVRKRVALSLEDVVEYIRAFMASKQYIEVTCEEEADGAFAVLSDAESDWYSVYSDLFSFDDPRLFADYGRPMSAELKTDVLGISCFDSDYMFLNLINEETETDAWAGVGSASGLGIGRRTNISAWKGKVSDIGAFKEGVKNKYVFAEEALTEVEQCLRLPHRYGGGSFEYLCEQELGGGVYLYFKLSEELKPHEPPVLVMRTGRSLPWLTECRCYITALNMGGASKGLSVFFIGPYVENDEITFSDVYLLKISDKLLIKKNNGRIDGTGIKPIELQKVRLTDALHITITIPYIRSHRRLTTDYHRRSGLRRNLTGK